MNAILRGAALLALFGMTAPSEAGLPLPRLSPRTVAHLAAPVIDSAVLPFPRLAPRLTAVSAYAAGPVRETRMPPISDTGFDAGRTNIVLSLENGLEIDYRVFTLLVRPGETIDLAFNAPVSLEHRQVEIAAAPVHLWTAPDEPGVETLILRDQAGAQMRLNILVMQAVSGDGEEIEGYRLGRYPVEPYRGDAAYLAPEYFARVDDGLLDLQISPHFRLGQFLCKQQEDGPHFLIVSERLLVKLEILLEAANDHGWRTDSFVVMSGYRTPAYNASIGNGQYSRHVYGGAADIYIDADGDGVMDDLNGDGRLDRSDAAALYDLVERLSRDEAWSPLRGGLGEYGPNGVHGGFVHVDERGWRARWGRPTH